MRTEPEMLTGVARAQAIVAIVAWAAVIHTGGALFLAAALVYSVMTIAFYIVAIIEENRRLELARLRGDDA